MKKEIRYKDRLLATLDIDQTDSYPRVAIKRKAIHSGYHTDYMLSLKEACVFASAILDFVKEMKRDV